MASTVLIPESVHPAAAEIVQGASGLNVIGPAPMSREETLQQIGKADALLIRSGTQADAELLAAAPRLRVISRAGVGVDNVDLAEATRRGVVVMNTPDGNTISTAEYTFGLILSLLRQIPAAHASLEARRWDRGAFMGVELRGKTLGIIGLGRIGQAVARRARAFEMTVIAHDAFTSAMMHDLADALGVELVSLDALLARADIITLHPALTEQTRGMIDAAALGRMKRGVYLINAARGALIVDADLAAALASGQVAGAALDVYTVEPPPPDHPLLGLPHVIHTPHLAASTHDAQITVAVDAARQIVDALLRGDYRNVVNPQILPERP